jgi:hypothetical protein
VTVVTALVPAGPYARAVSGSTGTGPSVVTSCPDARSFNAPSVTNVVSAMPALSNRCSRSASSQAAPAAVSITRPSTHQPTFVYDQ